MMGRVVESQPETGRRNVVVGDPKEVLKQRFGLDRFLEGQHGVIERLLAGKNVAAVFPTGGGKSLCYQLPSQMFDGMTVVVSPLIALMKDQCDALARRGVAAARIDSSLKGADFRETMDGIRSGRTKLLYVAPERFFNERFLASVGSLKISLFAIDEAHCISQWGHNFRPDYLKLAELTRQIAVERVLALTATATPEVLSDIRDAFDIEAEDAIRTKFYRPNLQLRSTLVDAADHYPTLVERLRERPAGATIVYVTLQRTAEEIAQRLRADRMDATAYHAGMDPEDRQRIQQEFIDSDRRVIVATIAFGMGIDKANIRYVYHFNPPKSLESYAQEIGRAGRDGEDAVCELLLAPGDRIVLENFVYGDTPSRPAIGRLIDLLAGQPDQFHISHYKFSYETDIRVLVLRTLLTYLELDGYLKATSPRYDTYKVKPLVPSKQILAQFSGERREFVANILAMLTKGRSLFYLNMVLATQRLGETRERIVKAVEYLSERQWIELQVADLVHGYRWVRRLDPSKKTLADQMHERLIGRESGEIARIDEVFDLATAKGCLAARLSKHFGESISQPCGRCTACRGEGPQQMPPVPSRSIGAAARESVSRLAEKFPDRLSSPRDRARFLCGLTSPGFSRSRLTKDPSFGVCDGVPFATVLEELGGT